MSKKERFMFIDELGDLFLYDVLLLYIYPRVFVCEDEFSCKFLFYEMESDNQRDKWLVTRIKKADYYDLVDRKVTIQHIYKKAAKRDLFSITKSYVGTEEAIFSSEYKDCMAMLPVEDVYAEKNLVDDVAAATLESARETGSTTLDVRLFPGTDRHFVPSSILTSLLKSVSSLADSIFGKRHTNTLRVCTAPGSCIVRFSFGDQVNLLDESDATHEVQVINNILSSESVECNLQQVKNKKGFIQSYTNLLETIDKTRSAVQITSAFPNSTQTNKIELSRDIIVKRKTQMEGIYEKKEIKERTNGKLIALDIKAKRFKLSLLENNEEKVISGIIDEAMLSGCYEIPGNYVADIIKISYVDPNDDSPKREYRLSKLTNA